jgi:hypothetical protein
VRNGTYSSAGSRCAMNHWKAEPDVHGAVGPVGDQHRHRPHRHKRFRVRPEAVGIGYGTFWAWPQPFSAASHSVSEAEDDPEQDAQPTVVPSSAEPKPLSEKEIARATALRGIRTCLALLACVFALVLVSAHFNSFNELGRWLLARMPQPIVSDLVTHEAPPRN